ncbi:hypothetical protein pipiens_016668 [Culex pipiens pipiens]|uniref:Uncharacterized protein n=1 Tax=Culex pipiens pipiens TaxID=38569 RepID=A0ABD1CKE6_CULPP
MLRLLEVDHPAAKVHFKLAKLQNEIFGDRTICIAAELLKNTRMSLQHASRLAVAYRRSTVLSVPGMLLLEMEVT